MVWGGSLYTTSKKDRDRSKDRNEPLHGSICYVPTRFYKLSGGEIAWTVDLGRVPVGEGEVCTVQCAVALHATFVDATTPLAHGLIVTRRSGSCCALRNKSLPLQICKSSCTVRKIYLMTLLYIGYWLALHM